MTLQVSKDVRSRPPEVIEQEVEAILEQSIILANKKRFAEVHRLNARLVELRAVSPRGFMTLQDVLEQRDRTIQCLLAAAQEIEAQHRRRKRKKLVGAVQ